MNREDIREHTMQVIFQMDAQSNFDYNNLQPISENEKAFKKQKSADVLIALSDNLHEIDNIISKNIENWTIDRLPKTELAILRNAVTEIIYIDSIPVKVSINEAVRMAKKYGDEKSYAFINSVLSKIVKSLDTDNKQADI